MDEAEEKIYDEALAAQLRQQAQRVHLKALAAGLLLTLAALALPMLR
jgi:hypothetical protein